jgi:hypothetical protein
MQQLIFDGQQFDDKKLVFDYDIQRESMVDLLLLPLHLHAPLPEWIVGFIYIHVKCLTGKTLRILVKGTDTIDNVKLRITWKASRLVSILNQVQNTIFDKLAFALLTDQQRLLYAGKQLEDGRIISEYGVKEDSYVYLFLRLIGGGYSDTKYSLGLVDIAQAISLWDWDGIMPGPVSLTVVVDIYCQVELFREIMERAFDCPKARS